MGRGEFAERKTGKKEKEMFINFGKIFSKFVQKQAKRIHGIITIWGLKS